MAGADRHGQQQGRGSQRILTQTQRNQLDTLTRQTAALAQRLTTANGDRQALAEQVRAALGEDEEVAEAYAERLGDARGEEAGAAADVALAIGELDPRREVAREARRAGVRLRSAGAATSLTIPTAGAARPAAAPQPLATPAAHAGPTFAEAYATRTRESGEVNLIVLWRDGGAADMLRPWMFQLDYWQTGVRDFEIGDVMSRQRIQRSLIEPLHAKDMPTPVKIGWAQARALVEEALQVNTWRQTEPGGDFGRYRAQVEERLLAEPADDALRAELEHDRERLAREGDRALCDPAMEAEETLGNWLGGWSFGDYGLAYDLLASDHPTRQRQSRAEYIALRRQWADEAQPAALRLTVIREQEQRASALWTPGAAPGRIGANSRRELEAFWSLTLKETPIGGQLDELPMGTLISPSTGRHWFWTSATMQREPGGLWLIARQQDEGAQAQAVPVEELTTRIKALREDAEKTAQSAPQDPNSPETVAALQKVTADLTTALHYDDALATRLPLDERVNREAINDARALSAHERAAALLERMLGRFSDDVDVRFELGVEQYLIGEQHLQLGQQEAASAWLGRATGTLTAVVEEAPTAQRLQGLGELLARQGHFTQATTRLREAIALDATLPALYLDLSEALMGQVTTENLDAPAPLDDAGRQQVMHEALEALRQAAKLDPDQPRLFTRIGAIYEALHQHEDAIITFEEAIRHDRGDDTAHYALGSIFLARRDYARARPLLEMASQLEPSALQYRVALASCYIAMSEVGEATRQVTILEKVAPHLPQVGELKAQVARMKKK